MKLKKGTEKLTSFDLIPNFEDVSPMQADHTERWRLDIAFRPSIKWPNSVFG
jgi:hypothetical protein